MKRTSAKTVFPKSPQGAEGSRRVRRVLLVDNYDSFTYNLVQAFLSLGCSVTILLNDACDQTVALHLQSDYDAVVISPGPGTPGGVELAGTGGTGCSERVLTAFRGRVPTLGVCLGHQLLAIMLGAQLRQRSAPMHGKASWVRHVECGLFATLPQPLRVARYHSLEVDPTSIGDPLQVLAVVDHTSELAPVPWNPNSTLTAELEIMALGVRDEPTWGVQFHPESFMTPEGGELLRVFLTTPVPHESRRADDESSTSTADGLAPRSLR